jgi:hypothetical protein
MNDVPASEIECRPLLRSHHFHVATDINAKFVAQGGISGADGRPDAVVQEFCRINLGGERVPDAKLIAAPPSTMQQDKGRAPAMHQTKQGAAIRAGIDHPNYRAEITLPTAIRDSLAGGLT